MSVRLCVEWDTVTIFLINGLDPLQSTFTQQDTRPGPDRNGGKEGTYRIYVLKIRIHRLLLRFRIRTHWYIEKSTRFIIVPQNFTIFSLTRNGKIRTSGERQKNTSDWLKRLYMRVPQASESTEDPSATGLLLRTYSAGPVVSDLLRCIRPIAAMRRNPR
jgi:hypothetical protein